MSEKQPIVVTLQHQIPEFVPGQGQEKLVCSLEGNRTWSSGLCDCSNDVSNCVLTAFCYPCVMCKLASRINELCCLPCFVPQADLAMRTRIRTLGGIQGTMCNDCMVVSCCPLLSTCQMKRELDAMKLY